ncbi:RNA polymerase sigma factor [Mobilicoccus massiliensis]|uniref:RNA polymerase sigma factor n=1 Tax=Mobilicoccus massiliensis TaxID=1522310 RepID=UPI00058ED9B5|nr:RNA polymerase sigma factor [Mobilicoccus massiliensis]
MVDDVGRMSGESSVEDIYRAQWGDLVRLASVVSGDLDDAVDLVQEVFVDFTRDAASIHNPPGWLRTAVIHRSRSSARRAGTRRRYLELHGWEHTGPVADRLVDVDVRRALAQLNPDQRATVFMRYYLDLPLEDIAEVLGCRVGTVKSRLNRAENRLKEILHEHP